MRRFLHVCLIHALFCWGAAGASEGLRAPSGPIILTITGKIERTNAPGEARFDKAMLEALGPASFTTGSALSDSPQRFEGVRLRAVLDMVGAKGKLIQALALNDYRIEIPMEDLRYEPILAMRVDGQILKLRDKGPLWIVYPRDDHKALQAQMFDSRWVWQLHRLNVE